MVLCEWDGGGDWRSERFLSVNGILTPKRCCFVVFIRVHALFLVVEQTAIKIWIIVCGSRVQGSGGHALVAVTLVWCWSVRAAAGASSLATVSRCWPLGCDGGVWRAPLTPPPLALDWPWCCLWRPAVVNGPLRLYLLLPSVCVCVVVWSDCGGQYGWPTAGHDAPHVAGGHAHAPALRYGRFGGPRSGYYHAGQWRPQTGH